MLIPLPKSSPSFIPSNTCNIDFLSISLIPYINSVCPITWSQQLKLRFHSFNTQLFFTSMVGYCAVLKRKVLGGFETVHVPDQVSEY